MRIETLEYPSSTKALSLDFSKFINIKILFYKSLAYFVSLKCKGESVLDNIHPDSFLYSNLSRYR